MKRQSAQNRKKSGNFILSTFISSGHDISTCKVSKRTVYNIRSGCVDMVYINVIAFNV